MTPLPRSRSGRPGATHLPGFRAADGAASATFTVRQRISHTSGFEGVVILGNDGQRRPQYLHGGRVSRRVAR